MNHAIESTRLVTFRVGEHLFAAEINAVQRVLRFEAPRALPDMPDWMEGVVDYQGTMVPVIDMRRRFGLPASAPGQHARLMVCAAPGGLAAMLVDAVLDVKPIQPSDLMDPPELFRGLAGEYLKGLTRRQGQLVVVLDVESLLSSQAPLRFQLDAAAS
ncbi:MAG TPA: chemotaxis protein CheW [Gemmatimonadaceae bacterium]